MKTQEIDLAFSPCPNDTFTFHAMLHGCIELAVCGLYLTSTILRR